MVQVKHLEVQVLIKAEALDMVVEMEHIQTDT
jgi:hypothetical protein